MHQSIWHFRFLLIISPKACAPKLVKFCLPSVFWCTHFWYLWHPTLGWGQNALAHPFPTTDWRYPPRFVMIGQMFKESWPIYWKAVLYTKIDGHVFGMIFPISKRFLYLSTVRLWTRFGVDTVKIQTRCHIRFSHLCKLAKKTIMTDCVGPRDTRSIGYYHLGFNL